MIYWAVWHPRFNRKSFWCQVRNDKLINIKKEPQWFDIISVEVNDVKLSEVNDDGLTYNKWLELSK